MKIKKIIIILIGVICLLKIICFFMPKDFYNEVNSFLKEKEVVNISVVKDDHEYESETIWLRENEANEFLMKLKGIGLKRDFNAVGSLKYNAYYMVLFSDKDIELTINVISPEYLIIQKGKKVKVYKFIDTNSYHKLFDSMK